MVSPVLNFATKHVPNCRMIFLCFMQGLSDRSAQLLQSQASARTEARSLCIARLRNETLFTKFGLFLGVYIDPFENESVLGRLNFPRPQGLVEPVTVGWRAGRQSRLEPAVEPRRGGGRGSNATNTTQTRTRSKTGVAFRSRRKQNCRKLNSRNLISFEFKQNQ